jgi:hypothetical protein
MVRLHLCSVDFIVCHFSHETCSAQSATLRRKLAMPHTLRFNHELAVIVLRTRQVHNLFELEAALDDVIHLPGFKEGLSLVIDFRASKPSLSPADIRQLVEYTNKTDFKWGKTKWLIIADDDVTYGLSRIYVALAERHEVTTQVFRTPTKADDWLGLGVEVADILTATPE